MLEPTLELAPEKLTFNPDGASASDGQRRGKVECTAVRRVPEAGAGVRPPRWKSKFVPVWVFMAPRAKSTLPVRLLTESMTPFEYPVVPEVWIEQDHPVVGNLVKADMLRSEPFQLGFAEVIFAVLLEIRQFLRIPALVDRVQVREREDGFDFPDLVGFDRVQNVSPRKSSRLSEWLMMWITSLAWKSCRMGTMTAP